MMKRSFFWIVALALFSSEIGVASAPKICLNMIVKDEAPVIERCLESVKNLIDYWVIVDTGSTDGTQNIIKKYLKEIPGELHERPWIHFGHNRNEALQLAKNQGDYLLFIDADEKLVFTSELDITTLDKDSYRVFVRVFEGEDKYFQAQRILLAKSHFDWVWEGELHENIICLEAKNHDLLSNLIILADSPEGHRSRDPQKSAKDAAVLEKIVEKNSQDTRALFFLAQCYEAGKNNQLALQKYRKRAAMSGSEQEIFWSLYRIGRLQEEQQMAPETILQSYANSFVNRASRVEPLYYMALQYAKIGNQVLSYALLKAGLSFPSCADLVVNEAWIYDYGLLFAFAKAALTLGKNKESSDAFKALLAKPHLPKSVRDEAGALSSLSLMPRKESHQTEGYTAAFQEHPERAEPLFYLAESFTQTKNLLLAYAVAKAAVSIEPPQDAEEPWIYEYGLLNKWGTSAFELQKFAEAIMAFETLLSKKKVPAAIRLEAKRKIEISKRIARDLERAGLVSF